jgi:hypothetical protein
MNNNYELKPLILNTSLRDTGSIASPSFLIHPEISGVVGYKLKTFNSVNGISTIDSRNNKLYFKEGTNGSLVATINTGNYNGTTICTELKTDLEAGSTVGNKYTVSYNSIGNNIIISTTGPSFSFATNGNSLSDSPNAYYELGLVNSVNISNASSVTSGQLDLFGLKAINLVSNALGSSSVQGNQKNIIASIPVNSSSLNVIQYLDHSSDYLGSKVNSLNQIDISLLDDRMRAITNIDKDYSIQLNLLID